MLVVLVVFAFVFIDLRLSAVVSDWFAGFTHWQLAWARGGFVLVFCGRCAGFAFGVWLVSFLVCCAGFTFGVVVVHGVCCWCRCLICCFPW